MRKKRTREEMLSPQLPSSRRALSLSSFSTSSPGPEQSADFHPETGLQGEELPPLLAAWVDRLPQDLLEVLRVIEEEGGGRVWLVGGCIRDCLAGLMPWEIDLATTLEPSEMLRLFPRALDTGSQYGTVTIRKGGVSVEATTLRADGTYGDGRRPETVTFGRSLKEDLLRRDFTINAMAVDVGRRKLFDPWGGQHDVKQSILRAVGDAKERLREDGLRAMRAYRFMDGKSGQRHADESLRVALRGSSKLLARVSKERIWTEFSKILAGPRAPLVVRRMAEDEVLSSVTLLPVSPRGLRALECLSCKDLPLWAEQATEMESSHKSYKEDVLMNPKPPKKPQPHSHYAFIDFEATCDDRRGFSPSEIIEFPVVLVESASGKVVSEFHSFVRPRVHPFLTDFCQELTGIKQKDVDSAPEFKEVLANMLVCSFRLIVCSATAGLVG
uniref:Poly A polymerase head domain-containing protein n=1 Tax=Guillardia theta TaxID=55529 RepID=A0A6U5ZT19_GUITH